MKLICIKYELMITYRLTFSNLSKVILARARARATIPIPTKSASIHPNLDILQSRPKSKISILMLYYRESMLPNPFHLDTSVKVGICMSPLTARRKRVA